MPENGHLFDEFRAFVRKDKVKTRKRRRKRLIIVGGIVLTLLVAIGGTLALLNTRTKDAVNQLEFGQAKIEVIENNYDWESKEVKLTATGDVPGVVRAMLIPYILNESGTQYISCDLGEMPAVIVGNAVELGDIVLELDPDWSENWFYKDGFFYYNKVLNPGETTQLLLTKVSLGGDTAQEIETLKEKYDGKNIKVEVMADILQSEGGAPAAQWHVTVAGSTVSP